MGSIIKQRLRRFNGTDYDNIYLSANVDDVVGTLGVSNGGTGGTTAASAVYNLTNPLSSLTQITLADADCFPVLDTSASTGKKITMGVVNSFIVNYCDATIRVTSPAGTAVVVTYGGETISTHTGTGSAVNVTVNHKGLWTLVGTLNGQTVSVDVEVTGDGVYDANIDIFINPLNTDQLTLGMDTVYFKEYPDLKWQVQHLDKCYVYLSLTEMTDLTAFGSNRTYSGSTIATKCTTFLNDTIPNIADYLESVTVNGVTNKVFIPSCKMFIRGGIGYDSADVNDPTFDWPGASSVNRICNYNGSGRAYYLSSPYSSTYVYGVYGDGGFGGYNPVASIGFRPCVKVQFKPFVNPLNTDQLTLGQHDVYFKEYPDIMWFVDHLDGNYAYLGLYNANETTKFNQSKGQVNYAGSTLAAKCTTFLNSTIPNIADYLESVNVHGATNKVFIPSYKMFSGTANPAGGDANDPTFDWPSASADNRKACVSNWTSIGNYFWLSSPSSTSYDWIVTYTGSLTSYYPTYLYGFRPEVKVQYKT